MTKDARTLVFEVRITQYIRRADMLLFGGPDLRHFILNTNVQPLGLLSEDSQESVCSTLAIGVHKE